MPHDGNRQKIFSRRAAILGGCKMLLFSTLIGRLCYLQIIESGRYATLARENSIALRLLPPSRGRILDRFGKFLAENRENFRVLIIAEQATDLEKTLDALEKIIKISQHERQRVEQEVQRKPSFVPVSVSENLSWEDMARIEVNTPDLPGIQIDVGQTRWYPHGPELAHILGYVGAVSEKEQTTREPLLKLPGFRIGKTGIEKIYDLALRGTVGTSQVEVNAQGRVIKKIYHEEGKAGSDLSLTIDLELQKFVFQRLQKKSASAVLLDVYTGDILAMTSSPTYDPNAFNEGLSSEEWQKLANNPHSPLFSRAVSGQYSPGSTFKMIVALAALEKGVITPQTKFFCSGYLGLKNSKLYCWKRHGHGQVDLHHAIMQSCDVYFYNIAKRTGISHIAAMARRFGLGNKLNIDLPGENAGLVPSDAWKRATLGVPWKLGETLITGIGQGYVLVTPLQLAIMTAQLANGGVSITPRLTHDWTMKKSSKSRSILKQGTLGLIPSHLKLIHKAMISVVNEPQGTAWNSAIMERDMKMAGKTGTVQVRRISKAEREEKAESDNLLWKERDHALFVGFAPIHAPRYAVSVVVEHGVSGSKTAAPIARDILYEAQLRNPIQGEGGDGT